jgi:hypothetical protein
MTADPTVTATRPVVRIAGVDKTFARGDQAVTKALEDLSLIHTPSPRDYAASRMPSSA